LTMVRRTFRYGKQSA